jgi:hypothetical protein
MSWIYTDSALISNSAGPESLASGAWSTLYGRTLDEISKPFGGPDETAVKRALISAMRHYRYHHFWFNEGVATFQTILSKQSYKANDGSDDDYEVNTFPSDLLRPVQIYMKISDRWHNLEGVTFDEIRWNVPTDSVEGYPDEWAWFNEQMWFAPVPNGAYTVRIDYVRDVGLPTYQYQGGVWTFYKNEVTAELLSDTYTNEWIVHAEELIRARAKADLFVNYYKDDANASRAASVETVALSELRKQGETKKAEIRREAWHI